MPPNEAASLEEMARRIAAATMHANVFYNLQLSIKSLKSLIFLWSGQLDSNFQSLLSEYRALSNLQGRWVLILGTRGLFFALFVKLARKQRTELHSTAEKKHS
jgi:hypothetical protein